MFVVTVPENKTYCNGASKLLNIVREKILIRKAKKSDRDAAELLIKANYKKLYSFLLRTSKQKELSEDLTQETFLKAWNSIEQFRGDCRFSTWLIGIGYTKYLDVRKQNRLQFDEFIEAEIANKEEKLSNNADLKMVKIMEAVSKLTNESQEIILLHYQENLSYSEIATILKIPKGTVKSRVSTALTKIRNLV